MTIQRIIQKFDAYVVKKNKWQLIPGSRLQLFYVVPTIYEGKTILLEDQTLIQTGDVVAEIHLNNPLMKQYDNVGRLMKDVKSELSFFTGHMEEEAYREIKAIFGTTVLHPVAKRLRFSVIDMEPSFRTKMIEKWEALLKKVFGKNHSPSHRKVKTCWMSRASLLKYFGRPYEEKNF